jgi:hypothetical protein
MPQYIQKPGGQSVTLESQGFNNLQDAANNGWSPVAAPTQVSTSAVNTDRGLINPNSVNMPGQPTSNVISTDEITSTNPTVAQADQKQVYVDRIVNDYNTGKLDMNAVANNAFIQAVAQAARGRAATADELAQVGANQYGLVGAKVKDVLGRFGLLSQIPGFGTEPPAETPQDTTTPESDMGTQPTALDALRDFADSYISNKSAARAETEEANGIADLRAQLQETQTRFNDLMTQIDTKNQEMDAENIINEEAKIALKEKIEGKVIPMSEINRQLLKDMNNLEQAQRLDRLYNVYEINTVINQSNALNRNLQLQQGNYQAAMQNVQDTMEDWTELQQLRLQIIDEQKGLEQEERARYETEINYQRDLALKGYAPIEDTATYNAIVKDLKVTADTFNNFFYKDPSNGKIYLRPQGDTWSEPYLMGGDYVQKNNMTGEIKVAVNMPKGSSSSNSSGTGTKEFWSAVDKGIASLQKGEPWGTVWNRVKARFPDMTNEQIDQALGKDMWSKEGAYEEFRQKQFKETNPTQWQADEYIWQQIAEVGDSVDDETIRQWIMSQGRDPEDFGYY